MRPILKRGLLLLILVLIGIQFIRVNYQAEPVETEVDAPSDVKAVLKRACYDCHSNETTWPAYAQIAPISWFVASHVEEGRDHLNLSTWNRLTPPEQVKKRQKMWTEVDRGEMPPWYYTPFHPISRLTAGDKAALRQWANAGQ